MEENTTVQTGTEEMADETSAAFDEGWEDRDEPDIPDDGQDDGDIEAEEPDTDSESEETEADADQREADGNEGGETDEASEGKEQGSEGEPNQAESFVLKHLGEEKSVGRDEVVQLAQKGMDYDRIREKWDGVKDDVARLRMYENFLGELAEARGADSGNLVEAINDLIDETRIRTMLAAAEARGEDLSPAAAAQQAVRRRTEYVPAGAAPVDPEEARQEKSQMEVKRLLDEYPDVQATDIPGEVWDDMNKHDGDLLGAYQRFENRKLKEELKNLKKELEDAKQQKKNKARSTGSTKSVGTSAGRDAFDEGWDAAY